MILTKMENFPQGEKSLLIWNEDTLGLVAIDNSIVEI